MFLVGRRVRKLTVTAQDRFADAVGYAGESLDALETVQAFGREHASSLRFGGAVEEAYKASVRRITTRASMTAMVTHPGLRRRHPACCGPARVWSWPAR